EVARLAERIGAKVFSDNRPNSLSVSLTHPLYAGELLNTIEPLLDQIEDADVVFFIGTETYTFSFPPEGPLAPRGARIIHLDLDPWEIGKNFPVDVAMLGDPKTTLVELTGAVEKKLGEAGIHSAGERRAWIEKELAASRREIAPKAGDDSGTLTKETFQAAFGEALPQGTALVDESLTMGHGGGLKSAIAGKVDSLFGMKGGGIGLGLPSALGVKKALPDTPVVCLSGDGSAMYAIQALWSAAKYVILNNKSYRILKERVLRLDGKTQEHRQFVAMDFKEPELDFIQMAQSMGVDAIRAKTPAELKEAMGIGLASGKPYLIDAHIEYERLEN
ncbi:MAG: thiamine pyrophosphate-binding protein, partial [Nitrospinae bacterium]|nr:thiamine pyrophosphate-binding protein [Nitrospinota bacterium]